MPEHTQTQLFIRREFAYVQYFAAGSRGFEGTMGMDGTIGMGGLGLSENEDG